LAGFSIFTLQTPQVMRLSYIPFFLIFFISNLYSNSEIDSLQAEIPKTEGIKKTENINRLALKLRMVSLDSSLKYAQLAMDRSISQNDLLGLATSNKTFALFHRDKKT